MTPRGRRTLALGFALYVAAWGFGTRAMYPVAVGLMAAPLLAWLWVRLTARPVHAGGGGAADRRPARPGGVAHGARADGHAARLSPRVRAGRPLHGRRRGRRRRGSGAAAPYGGVRPALDPRLPAGREPAPCALALDR